MPGRPSMRPLATAILLALSTAAASHDDPRHAEVKDLDEVVVRANPLPRTAEDLGRPVEVLAGSRQDAVRADSLGETVSRLPSVRYQYFVPGVGWPGIRSHDGPRVQVPN